MGCWVWCLKRSLLGIVLNVLLCVGLFGISMPSAVWALGLDEAYLAARDKDSQFLANKAYLESFDGLEQQALSTVLPTISLEADQTKVHDAVISGQDSDSRQYGIAVKQSLVNPKLWKTKAQTDITLKRVPILRLQYEMDLMRRVSTAYFDVAIARAEQQLAFLQAKLSKDQFDLAQEQFAQGLLSELELQDAKIRHELDRTQWLMAQNTVLIKQQSFRDMTGLFLAQQVNVILSLPETADVFYQATQTSSAQVSQIDLTGAPEVKLAQFDYESAQFETEKYRMEHLPTLDLSASWNRTKTETGGADFHNHDSRVSLSLSVPIFSGFLTNGRIQEAKSLEQKAFYALQEKRTSLSLSVNQAKYQIEAGFWLAKQQFSQFQNKQRQLEYQQTAFEMGSRTPQDVLYADIQKQSAYVEALKARVNLEQNLILLESLTGHLSIETLLAISKRVIQ